MLRYEIEHFVKPQEVPIPTLENLLDLYRWQSWQLVYFTVFGDIVVGTEGRLPPNAGKDKARMVKNKSELKEITHEVVDRTRMNTVMI